MKSSRGGSHQRVEHNFRGVAAALFTGVLIASCSSGPTEGKEIKLTVGLFGDFGYRKLYAQYEKEHPGIHVVERVTAFEDHHTSLAEHLATGRGASDVEAIETGYIGRFKANPGKFVNFLDYGVGAQRRWWLPWKWDQSLSTDGKSQIGLGTDVGGLAMCYRTDLFEKAGLPTDRHEVSALWPDWNAYFKTGERYTADAPAGTRWFDGGATVFNAIIGQARTAYYDANGTLVVKTNPAVRQDWNTVTNAIEKGQSARLTPLTNDWNNGFATSRFATIPCPAWMTAFIQSQAKSSAGKWDVATVPGSSGNWGGSFLTVPKQGHHTEEAVKLARWLTAPEQQKAVFKESGNLPSQPALYKDPSVTGLVKPFFNNAPVGRIFADSALKLKPQPQGPKSGQIMVAFTNGFSRVEEGHESPAGAWNSVLADIEHGER